MLRIACECTHEDVILYTLHCSNFRFVRLLLSFFLSLSLNMSTASAILACETDRHATDRPEEMLHFIITKVLALCQCNACGVCHYASKARFATVTNRVIARSAGTNREDCSKIRLFKERIYFNFFYGNFFLLESIFTILEIVLLNEQLVIVCDTSIFFFISTMFCLHSAIDYILTLSSCNVNLTP